MTAWTEQAGSPHELDSDGNCQGPALWFGDACQSGTTHPEGWAPNSVPAEWVYRVGAKAAKLLCQLPYTTRHRLSSPSLRTVR